MEPKMIVLDLDGTTLNNARKVDPELSDYLQSLRKKGILVCIATGRTMYEMHLAIPFDFEVDGIINSNGMNVHFGGKEIYRQSIEAKAVETLVDLSLVHEIHHEIHHHDGRTTAKISPMRDRAHELTVHGYTSPEWTKDVDTKDVEKILFFKEDHDILADFLGELRILEKILPFTAAFSAIDLIDISGRNITKATGVAKILEQTGLSFSDIIAFGDGGNDLPLFHKAGRSVAMKNAPVWVQEQATEVTDYTNNELGLLKHLQGIYGLDVK